MIGAGTSIYIYSLLPNGTYEESRIIDVGSRARRFACRKNLIIAPSWNGKIKIYRGSDYELVQTIDEGTTKFEVSALLHN